MTTANKVTIVRILMIPIFMIVMLSDSLYSDLIALIIFAIASVTDAVDGYIARRYNQITDFGRFLDPLADKLLVTAAILIFVERGQMDSWIAMIIIAREFAVTGLRLIAVGGGKVIAAAISGKIKTFVSIVAICIMLTPMKDIVIIKNFLDINDFAVAIIATVTLWSGIDYFVTNWKVLSWQNQESITAKDDDDE